MALSTAQRNQYNRAILDAFPRIISESEIIKKFWSRLESYFPEYQQYLISEKDELIGFMNAVPFQFGSSLGELPDSGWDWMIEKGISDFENNIVPNYLGGLQVIVRKEYQKCGYSKTILAHAKSVLKTYNLVNLIIPIRPTRKHEYPSMAMSDYVKLRANNKIFDPWIRTHVRGGAEIVKVCNRSMTMSGDVKFWESMLNKRILKSGKYNLEGALDLISIDLENDVGQYIEPNIWIKYN